MEEYPGGQESNIAVRFYRAAKDLGKRALARWSTMDLNPHEGRLRSSAMPEKYMDIPDDVSALTQEQQEPPEE